MSQRRPSGSRFVHPSRLARQGIRLSTLHFLLSHVIVSVQWSVVRFKTLVDRLIRRECWRSMQISSYHNMTVTSLRRIIGEHLHKSQTGDGEGHCWRPWDEEHLHIVKDLHGGAVCVCEKPSDEGPALRTKCTPCDAASAAKSASEAADYELWRLSGAECMSTEGLSLSTYQGTWHQTCTVSANAEHQNVCAARNQFSSTCTDDRPIPRIYTRNFWPFSPQLTRTDSELGQVGIGVAGTHWETVFIRRRR